MLKRKQEEEVAFLEEESCMRAEQQKEKCRAGFGRHPIDKELILTPEERWYECFSYFL